MARLLGWEWQVKRCLGLPAKLNPAVNAHGEVNGVVILVFVRNKQSFHRVMAYCPECSKLLSAGRLNQHWNKVHADKSWPTFYWDYVNNCMTNRDPYLDNVPGASKSFTAIGQ